MSVTKRRKIETCDKEPVRRGAFEGQPCIFNVLDRNTLARIFTYCFCITPTEENTWKDVNLLFLRFYEELQYLDFYAMYSIPFRGDFVCSKDHNMENFSYDGSLCVITDTPERFSALNIIIACIQDLSSRKLSSKLIIHETIALDMAPFESFDESDWFLVVLAFHFAILSGNRNNTAHALFSVLSSHRKRIEEISVPCYLKDRHVCVYSWAGHSFETACRTNSMNLAQLLFPLCKKSWVEMSDLWFRTSCNLMNSDMVKFLTMEEEKQKVKAAKPYWMSTSVRSGKLDIVKLTSTIPGARGKNYETSALSYAQMKGYTDIIDFLQRLPKI